MIKNNVLGTKQVAKLLGKCPATVRKMAREGEIPARRRVPGGPWEFHRDDLASWLAEERAELVAWLTRSNVSGRSYSGGVWRK